MDLNSVNLSGRLTRDPEIKDIGEGKRVAKLSVAVDIGWGDKKKTAFIDVTAWGKVVDFLEKYFSKGMAILITGRLNYESWTDRESGKQRNKLSVTAESVYFKEKKTEGQQSTGNQSRESSSAGEQDSNFEPPY